MKSNELKLERIKKDIEYLIRDLNTERIVSERRDEKLSAKISANDERLDSLENSRLVFSAKWAWIPAAIGGVMGYILHFFLGDMLKRNFGNKE